MPNQHEIDYHFLFISADLPGVWFTQAARQYWLRFEPIVTHDWELISRTPHDSHVAVTIVTKPQHEASLREQAAKQRDDIFVDVLLANSLTELEVILNQRAHSGLLLGN